MHGYSAKCIYMLIQSLPNGSVRTPNNTNMISAVTAPLSALGAFVVITTAYRVLSFIWLYTRPSNLHKYLHATSAKPAWALVTGASDGIGKALAHELAAQGFNVVLHGRNAPKLEGVKGELSKQHPALSFRILLSDAHECHVDPDKWLSEIVRTLEDINLTVLVNNAGGGTHPAFGRLEEFPYQQILDTVHLNAMFPTLITAALIPMLVNNGPGLIVNICSLADNGLPLTSFYGGAKSSNHVTSLALWREMKLEKRNVEVIAHRVGMVTGTQHVKKNTSIMGPSPRTMARAILAKTGCGRKSVIPYWAHGLQHVMLGVMPEWAVDRALIDTMTGLRDEEGEGKFD
ncbi:short chain dehydrogenase [Xylariales sp. AK1849]|nr:short chain dehydrogenase [Xylariales sp. AK1849]